MLVNIHSERYFIGGQWLGWFWEICVLGQDSCFSPAQSPASGLCSPMDRVHKSQGRGRSAVWGNLRFSKSVPSSGFEQWALGFSAVQWAEHSDSPGMSGICKWSPLFNRDKIRTFISLPCLRVWLVSWEVLVSLGFLTPFFFLDKIYIQRMHLFYLNVQSELWQMHTLM